MVQIPAASPGLVAGDVYGALEQTGYGDLRRIEVRIEDSRVCLSGRVSSFFLKQIAQCSVRSVPGVRAIQNDLTVSDGPA